MSLSLQELRFFCAEILGAALLDLFPNIKLVEGADTPVGFYYDCVPSEPLDQNALHLIEEKMRSLIKSETVRTMEMMRENAIELFRHHKQPILAKKLEYLPENIVQLTQIGNFYDVAYLPDIAETDIRVALSLQMVETLEVHLHELPEMTVVRVSGTAFFENKELKKFLKQEKSAKKMDHRVLGKDLGLFETLSGSAAGTWFWHPKGGVIRDCLLDWWRQVHRDAGFYSISTPRVMRESSDPFQVKISLCRREYVLPEDLTLQHSLVFQSRLHSYRELPIRYTELLEVYENICPSQLKGLFHPTQYLKDTAHIFCTEAQVPQELISSLQFIDKTIKILGFEHHWVLLNESERPAGTRSQWENGVNLFVESLKQCGFNYELQKSKGPLKGPKVVLQLTDALGRRWDGPYLGFDFEHPKRLGLKYQGPDDRMHAPIVIRRSFFGSLERMIGILLEHFSGELPLWLAPEQVRIIPVTEMQFEYGAKVRTALEKLNLRVGFEYKSGKLAEKIHSGIKAKIPYLIILGDREEMEETLAVRKLDQAESRRMNLESLGRQLVEEAALKLLPIKGKLD